MEKSRRKRRSSSTIGWKARAQRLIQPESRLSRIIHLDIINKVSSVEKSAVRDPGLIRRGIQVSDTQVQEREEAPEEAASILGCIGR